MREGVWGGGGDGEERPVLAEAAGERKYLKRIKGMLVPSVQHNLSLTLYKNIRFSLHSSSVLQRLEWLLFAGFSVSTVEAGLKVGAKSWRASRMPSYICRLQTSHSGRSQMLTDGHFPDPGCSSLWAEHSALQ